MSRLSTLNYLINSYCSEKKELDFFQIDGTVSNKVLSFETTEAEPSKSCIDTILNFASQYAVLKSEKNGAIELNLN